MNKFFKKAAVAVATGSMVFGSFMPAALGQLNLEITGNGSGSSSELNFSSSSNTVVTQTNVANISNNVDVDADTGGNDAEGNTGGDVAVSTGDSSVSVGVSNQANSNAASVDSCNGCLDDLTVAISGNGSDTDNEANVAVSNSTYVTQTNVADISNNVDIDSDTGDNDANDNTGGDVTIETGDASAEVGISNSANANVASVSNSSEGEGDGLSIWITGNGADSSNLLNLALASSTVVDQSNYADVSNDVDVDADSGDNDAEDNTGGDVMIETGDAEVEVGVDNAVNFNVASVEECCFTGGTVKIGGNGVDSDNELNAALSTGLFATQDNVYDCEGGEYELLSVLGGKHGSDCNDVDVDAETGDNDANDNTAWEGDPSVETGDAGASVELATSANSNGLTVGGDVLDEVDVELPDGFPFDFDGVLGWWFAWMSM
jgi:hypothetical protein